MPLPAKPFNFSRIKKLTRAELTLWQTLYRYGADLDLVGQFLPELAKVVSEMLRVEAHFRFVSLRLEACSRWQGRLAGEGVFAVLAAGPAGEKAILLFDSVFALSMIDRLLGGDLAEIPGARRLTDIEEGAMSYLLARGLQALFDFFGGEQGHFRLERIYGSRDSLAPFLGEVETVALVELHVNLMQVAGEVQLVLPDRFILKELDRPPTVASGRDQGIARRRQRLRLLGDIDYPLVACLGQATLKEEELGSLESGDIVLIPQAHCRFREGEFSGELLLLPEQGKGPRMLASVRQSKPRAALEIKEIYGGV